MDQEQLMTWAIWTPNPDDPTRRILYEERRTRAEIEERLKEMPEDTRKHADLVERPSLRGRA